MDIQQLNQQITHAQSLVADGQLQRAIEIYHQLDKQFPNQPQVLYHLGKAYQLVDDYSQASAYFGLRGQNPFG